MYHISTFGWAVLEINKFNYVLAKSRVVKMMASRLKHNFKHIIRIRLHTILISSKNCLSKNEITIRMFRSQILLLFINLCFDLKKKFNECYYKKMSYQHFSKRLWIRLFLCANRPVISKMMRYYKIAAKYKIFYPGLKLAVMDVVEDTEAKVWKTISISIS